MAPKLIVFGIDGASHEVTGKLMAEGKLPHMSQIAANGASGSLQSTFPPHTAPGWASMFTGGDPGEHGIFQFWHTQNPEYIPRMISVNDFGREPLWRSLERHGLKVGVVNVPMSHPPQPLKDGYMISWPLSATIHYSEPRMLIHELAREGLHYHSDIVTMYRGQEDYLDLSFKYIEGRTQALEYLQQKYPVDALFVVYTELDRVSHHYWGAGKEPSQDVVDTYVAIDKALGQVADGLSDETLLVVASDHGFGACACNLNIHVLLEKEGLAAFQFVPVERPSDAERGNDIRPDGMRWFSSTQSYVRTMDWENTYAYMPTPGCFGINLNRVGRESRGIVSENQVKGVESRLFSLFRRLKDPEGDIAFDLVPSSEVYKGDRVDKAPDYILLPRKWDVMPHTHIGEKIWDTPSQQAIHRPDGILFARGMSVPKGARVQAKIEDVTPLILAQLGLPVPEDITGHWLFDPPEAIQREDAGPVVADNRNKLSPMDENLLEKRLSELGYM